MPLVGVGRINASFMYKFSAKVVGLGIGCLQWLGKIINANFVA